MQTANKTNNPPRPQPPMRPDAPREAIMEVAATLFAGTNAVQVATLGGPYTPWILGAYFAQDPNDPNALVLMVEKHGKSMMNLRADPRVAFTVNSGDATQDFAQGGGIAEVMGDDAAEAVMAALVAKMPWFQLYTPCSPVRLRIRELFLTSFARGWMPAQRVVNPDVP